MAEPTVVAASGHSCGLSRAGVVSCWGNNTFGQLGRGNTAAGSGASPIAGTLRFRTLSASGSATCGITVDGKVFCWGQYRPGGQIQSQPVAVLPAVSFQSLSVGTRDVCALTAGGEAWCWGENTFYQLGLGPSSNEQSEGPGQVVGGLHFSAVNAGERHTCGIDQAGSAWCWGSNSVGELGVASDPRCPPGIPCSSEPLPVTGGLTFASIETGFTGSCGVASDARLVCWGAKLAGFYSPVASGTPVPVPAAAGIAVRQVGSGINFTCVLSTAGTVLCMGGNEFGQLGRGASDGVLHDDLVPVSGGRTFVSLSVGLQHACATQADGAAYCWGSNKLQQLGSTTTDTCGGVACSPVPARVTVWSDD